jgi:hypothetical protein
MQEDADTEERNFSYQFSDRAYLLGSSNAILYISCEDSDDMSVFVQLHKVGKLARSYIAIMSHWKTFREWVWGKTKFQR